MVYIVFVRVVKCKHVHNFYEIDFIETIHSRQFVAVKVCLARTNLFYRVQKTDSTFPIRVSDELNTSSLAVG